MLQMDDLLFGEPSLVRRNEMIINEMIINETINEMFINEKSLMKPSLMKQLMKWNDR